VVLRHSPDVPGGRELLSLFDLSEGDVVTAIGSVDVRGQGGAARLLQAANDRYIRGEVINALVVRGDLVLPTYVMRASYDWMRSVD
jgi:hypothetical protein